MYKRYQKEPESSYLENALTDFQLADQLTDVISLNTGEQLSKLFWREKGANLYIQAIAVCNKLQLSDLAYYFMEKNKALLLSESISKNTEFANLPKNISDQEIQLQKKIYKLESQVSKDENSSDLKDKLFNAKIDYKNFKDSMVAQYPAYYARKIDVDLIPLETVKKELK